jgi:hypothetical protein
MKKTEVTCSECGADFQRLELASMSPSQGQYCCSACGSVLETFNATTFVAYRLIDQGPTR